MLCASANASRSSRPLGDDLRGCAASPVVCGRILRPGVGKRHSAQMSARSALSGLRVYPHKQLYQEAVSQVQSLPERGIPPIIINFQ